MRRNQLVILSALFLSGLMACGGEETPKTDGRTDDAKSEANSNNTDAIEVKHLLGEISGSCGVLDDEEWNSDQPFFFRNSIDFGDIGYIEDYLSDGARYIATHDNAGGSSIKSEAISFEMLNRCEGAKLLKIETEVEYQDPSGKITDILVEIDGLPIGVSVTRAMAYNRDYTIEDAKSILKKKLSDLPLSQANAAEENAWGRSILYVMAQNDNAADLLEQAFTDADSDLVRDAIVMVTVSDGEDGFIYSSSNN